MTYLVELPIGGAGGATELLKVEVEPAGSDGLVQVARPGQVIARATRSLGEMLAGIRPVAENFVSTFRGMVHAPDEVSMEFGLSLSAAADVVISSTAAAANFKVTLTWHSASAGDSGTEPAHQPASAVPVQPSVP
ncbi:CU044_2847 family protein [Kitasatospora sp. NPDC006697]|uniref:CU044_2847 family protein n=1 Tax=Kitasatospora sp. NPDC006697 TaxID=3364020 RepID=UPI0036AB9C64